MSQSGYTSLQLYHSTVPSAVPAAANLVAGELSINTADGILYYKDAAGNVASIRGSSGSVSGFSGYSGYSGISGYSGFSGYSGRSGAPGGSSGYSGFSGYSGASSFSGYSGYSGYSGTGVPAPGTSGNLLVSNGSIWQSQSKATAFVAALNSSNSFTGSLTPSVNNTYDLGASGISGSSGYVWKNVYTNSVSNGLSGSNSAGLNLVPSNAAFNFSEFSSIYGGTTNITLAVSNSTFNPILQCTTSEIITLGTYPIRCTFDGGSNLGSPSYRWATVYATNGSINTSDQNEKTEIAGLDDAEKRVATRIKGLLKKFKFKDAVAKKGTDGARIHVGIMAQEVGDAFRAEGLDPHRYGMFCYDEWEATDEILYPNGTVQQPARAAGSRYGVRYDELLAFIIAAL
jgi:Chaperone of endosialidase